MAMKISPTDNIELLPSPEFPSEKQEEQDRDEPIAGAELVRDHGSLARPLDFDDGKLDPKKFPTLPEGIFSDEVQRIIDEVSISKSIPKEMTMGIVLAFASACIGRARGVIPRRHWKEHANLFMILIAESGSGKSHAVEYIFKDLYKAEEIRKAHFKIECRQYLEDLNSYRKSKDPDKKMPVKPKNIQYVLDESTMEAASERMEDNPKGLMWLQDEMSGFLVLWINTIKAVGMGKDVCFQLLMLSVGAQAGNQKMELPKKDT